MLLGVSDRKLETSVTPYKVSWSVPNNSATLRSMVCSFRCLPAAPACGLLPSAAAQKSLQTLFTKQSTDTVHMRSKFQMYHMPQQSLSLSSLSQSLSPSALLPLSVTSQHGRPGRANLLVRQLINRLLFFIFHGGPHITGPHLTHSRAAHALADGPRRSPGSPGSPMVPHGPPWSPMVPHGPQRSPAVPSGPQRSSRIHAPSR